MYLYTPDEIDRTRAHHQAVIQGTDDVDVKRIGNLGELAFEQFCREYLPAELWEWLNEDALRQCNPESFAAHDFDVFGYGVDVKTSRDVSAFKPDRLLETDPDDDIIVMVWHRDNEDGLTLLGWERTETLQSKVEMQEAYAGDEPAKLAHLSARPMNELLDLGPNTAHMNQQPQNPFEPGDRVVKADDDEASVGVVVEVLPPEKDVALYGQTLEAEVVKVAFPDTLDNGPGDWRTIHRAKLASYCVDQEISLYAYKHSNLDYAENTFVVGDYVIKPDYEDPDPAVVIDSVDPDATERNVTVAFLHELDIEVGEDHVTADDLSGRCEDMNASQYSYSHTELQFISLG